MDVQVIGAAVGVHLPLSDASAASRRRTSCCPPNTLVRLHVTSLDAIHSFWAYQLGVKADANPGVDNIVYVETKGPLTFDIHCAELCGLWHGYMFDTGQVVDPSDVHGLDQAAAGVLRARRASTCRRTRPRYLPDPQRRAG